MDISPETKKISEIFPIEGHQEYQIPIYQRNYSWGNKEIETLIDDITIEDEGYYIGNLLVTKKEEKNIYEIVDGQQRLTTIALIFIAIYERLEDYVDSEAKNVGSLQNDIKRKLLINGEIIHPRYVLLASDDEIFKDLLKKVIDIDSKKWGHRRFGKRYNFILDTLKEKFTDFKALKHFYHKLNGIEILKITVSKLSDAFSIFSALNSKGLRLTLVDLLKNEYLKQATIENRDSEEALEEWENLVNIFARDEEITVSDVTQFLLNNYDAIESNSTASITKNSALELYSKLIKQDSKYVRILKDRAEWFAYLKYQQEDKYVNQKIISKINELNYLDPSQAYPLLLFLFVKKSNLKLNDGHIIKILEDIIKFFVRRNITLRPKASNVRSMFVGLNRKIRSTSLFDKDIVNLIHHEIIAKSDTNIDFKNQLIQEGVFDKNASTTRYMLIQLERSFGTYFNKSRRDTLEEQISTKNRKKQVLQWTIEHILPQGKKLPDVWKKSIAKDESTNIRAIQEEYVHKLGNLTLTPYNSELGQKSFEDKKEMKSNEAYVGLRLELFLNKSILDEKESWDTKNSWTVEDIERRTKSLAEKVINIFQF